MTHYTYFNSYTQFTLIYNLIEQRNLFIEELKNKGIPTSIFYPKVLSRQEAYKNVLNNSRLNKNSLKLVDRVVSIPIRPYLSKLEIRHIIGLFNFFISD